MWPSWAPIRDLTRSLSLAVVVTAVEVDRSFLHTTKKNVQFIHFTNLIIIIIYSAI